MRHAENAGVYSIFCLTSGKQYIGSSVDIFNRYTNEHKALLLRERHWNPHLQRAWNKYGESNFEFLVVKLIPFASRKRRVREEQLAIDSHPFEMLYNISRRADCPETTEEIRAIRSLNAKKQHAAGNLGVATWISDPKVVGRKIAETRRKNDSYSHEAPNFEWTDERKDRVSRAMKARRKRENELGIKIVWSEEGKQNASRAALARAKQPISQESHEKRSSSQKARFAREGGMNKGKIWMILESENRRIKIPAEEEENYRRLGWIKKQKIS